ncbi:MAG: carbon-nitrogen hydrolase family protein [Acidimicrobiales bacterium]
MRVAACQISTGLDKAANLVVVAQALRLAGEAGATLVLLPEASMCGFGSLDTDLSAFAEDLEGPFVSALTQMAGRSRAVIVAGMFEKADRTSVFNTVVAVAEGGLLAAYRKVHLYDSAGWCESERFIQGEPGGSNAPVIEVGELAVGLLDCYDLRFPEAFRPLVDKGATVLAVPAAWIPGPAKQEQWRALLVARAIENTAYVVGAAQCAPHFCGGSCIIDPTGRVVSALGALEGDVRPALAIGDIDPKAVDSARERLPVLAHRRFSVVPGSPA